jgi:GDP-L-fucose synthase
MLAKVTGFEGRITYDSSKPDGAPRKLMDVSRLTRLGWRASTALPEGITRTYDWFCAEQASGSAMRSA